jgi:hypothetical protein
VPDALGVLAAVTLLALAAAVVLDSGFVVVPVEAEGFDSELPLAAAAAGCAGLTLLVICDIEGIAARPAVI